MQNLSNCCPVFQIKDFISKYKLSAIIFSFLESIHQFFCLFILVSNNYLHGLEVFDIDIIVLVSLRSVLELLGESVIWRRNMMLISDVSLRILIRFQPMPFLCVSDTYSAPICSFRVLFLHLIIELMKPPFLCLIATQAFVPEWCKLFLTTERILLLYAKLLSIDAWMNPSSECFCGAILWLLL